MYPIIVVLILIVRIQTNNGFIYMWLLQSNDFVRPKSLPQFSCEVPANYFRIWKTTLNVGTHTATYSDSVVLTNNIEHRTVYLLKKYLLQCQRIFLQPCLMSNVWYCWQGDAEIGNYQDSLKTVLERKKIEKYYWAKRKENFIGPWP